jgi:hypothetical protein
VLRTYKYLILHAPHVAFNFFFLKSVVFQRKQGFSGTRKTAFKRVAGEAIFHIGHDQNARTDDIDNVEYILGAEKKDVG